MVGGASTTETEKPMSSTQTGGDAAATGTERLPGR
jgi:hypothetical protein